MMFKKDRKENSDIKETLSPILRVLSQLGGRFSFADDEGRQFVIMRQEDLKTINTVQEKQLTLPSAPERIASADDVLEKINREIALWQMQELEEISESEQGDDFMSENREEFHQSQKGVPSPPSLYRDNKEAKRVRFESITGDLDPDLQD